MEKFSFFNSVNGDRRYKAEDWANYFNKFITNGYFPNIASNLQVIASGTNMKVTLRAGAAWINGYMYNNTTDLELTIQTADAVNSRKDRVVLRLDHEKREIKAYVKKGTPSSSPVAPALQRDADAYELAVAEVHVRNGVVVITQEAVTDVRLNKDLCGVVNSLLQADTTMIFNQYWDWFVRTKQKYEEDNSVIMSDFRKFMEDEKKRYNTEFTAWFQNLKNVLDTNTAGNLLNEINKINDKWNATLVELDKKSQAVQHGLNVINAPFASPLNIEIQGRTLANLLGQTALDPAKYYLYVPGKGTTKITAGSNTYEGVAKFTGQSTVSYTIKQDFRGKVAGSTVENGHKSYHNYNGAETTLKTPSEFPNELPPVADANGYGNINSLDGKTFKATSSKNGAISQQLFSFDIIRTLQDKYGSQIWQGKTTLAEKVAIAKQVITKLACNWWGFGSGPSGNKANILTWEVFNMKWGGAGSNNHTSATPSKITRVETSYISDRIDSNGLAHYLAYAEASNGTVASVINTDYIELELEVNTNLPILEDALYEVDQATYNKINVDPEFSGQKLMDKFPYVQGVQHLNPVVVAESGNLIPPFTEWETVSSVATIMNPYELSIAAMGQQHNNTHTITVLPNTTYSFSYKSSSHVRYDLQLRDSNSVVEKTFSCYDGLPLTFTTSGTTKSIRVNAYNYPISDIGTWSFSYPSLVLGDKPKPFAPRNPSYLYTNTVLAGQNGVNDVLCQEDGQWKVLRKWSIDKSTKAITLLPKPVIENVQVEGELVVSGVTQVTVDSGVVVREKVTPKNDSSNYYINLVNTGYEQSRLKYKASKIVAVYKDGTIDNKWIKNSSVAWGNEKAYISNIDFDPTAEYTVTYLIQDKHQFTTNVIDAKVIYNQSLASTVREVVEKQADNSTLRFAQQAKVSELTAKTREYGLRLTPRRSGKDENDIFTVTEYKMVNGMVRKRSVLSNPNAYGSYLTRTETEYLENGAVQKVTLLDLIYDADGNFIDEVERT